MSFKWYLRLSRVTQVLGQMGRVVVLATCGWSTIALLLYGFGQMDEIPLWPAILGLSTAFALGFAAYWITVIREQKTVFHGYTASQWLKEERLFFGIFLFFGLIVPALPVAWLAFRDDDSKEQIRRNYRSKLQVRRRIMHPPAKYSTANS